MHGATCIFWANLTPFSLKEYYGVGDDVIALLLNWGPIIYIPGPGRPGAVKRP
jgi:hypothetical protein